MQRWVNDIVGREPIERTIVFGSAMAPYLLDQSRALQSRVLFDMVDVDSDKWRQYAASSSGFIALDLCAGSPNCVEFERRAAIAVRQDVACVAL